MQRCSDGVLKTILVGHGLPKVRKGPEGMYQLMLVFELSSLGLKRHVVRDAEHFKKFDRVVIHVGENDLRTCG